MVPEFSLTRLIQQLQTETISLTGYLEQTLERMEQIEPVIHSFLPEENRKLRLLLEAKALLERFPAARRKPPLYGILVGVKDIINVDHLPTSAGSKLPASAFSGEEAAIVTRLKEAGALILGKTACTEFAYFQPGKTKNPHKPAHTPGGSSSGSAAAVAAGITPLTLGTQTIASIIRPAAYCGVFGFKPSYNRIPLSGVFPFSHSADHLGFFTPDLEGISLTAKAVIENWNERVLPEKPVLGIPASDYLNQADEPALRSFKETVDKLRKSGYEIHNSSLFSKIRSINELHQDLIAAEFAQNHKELYHQYSSLYSEHSAWLFLKGQQIAKERLETAREHQQILRYEITEIMEREEVDLWITPAATTAAPEGLDSTGSPLMSLPWTFAGLPSLSIPSAKNEKGLPLGLQIVSSFGEDESLLSYAREITESI
jgi:Asp-tRNA(Asn)/Glu-tRNA(Gln) amidotransferase A subunit family amidase